VCVFVCVFVRVRLHGYGLTVV